MKAAAYGPPADESIKMLRGVLGEEFANNPFSGDVLGNPTTLLGSRIFIFNSIAFVLGDAHLLRILIGTIADSANDGEVLGKKGSGVWMPARISAGIFGMLPVLGGFSIMQGIMMVSIALGVGAANLLTTKIIDQTRDMQAILPAFSAT